MFNHDSRKGADNLKQCELLRDSMSSAQIRVSGSVIADCTDYSDVSSALIDKALDFLAGSLERNDSEYSGRLQEDINRSVSQLSDNLSRLQDFTRDGRASDDDADMFDLLFGKVWKEIAIGIQSCVGTGSELRDAKGTPCEPLKERIEAIFNEAESGQSFTFSEEEIRKKYMEYGDTIRVYPECLHILRTQLSTRMQEDMDDILNGVMMNMKDKFGRILGRDGRLSRKFGSDDHEILGRLIEYITSNKLEDRVPTILHGLKLLDPLDEANISQGVPRNEAEVLDMLQDLYEQAVYEMRKRFDGVNGIYPEPNNAAFAAAEEFKDVMIRSGSDEELLKLEWKRLYRPIRGDVWPE